MTRKRPCLNCGHLTTNRSRCTQCQTTHTRQRDRERLTREPWRRFYATIEWRRTRRQHLRDCNHQCEIPGCQTPTYHVDVHHITPLADGGHPTHPTNRIALCRNHHAATEATLRRLRNQHRKGTGQA